MIASIATAPTLPHRIAALREEARETRMALRMHERKCPDGFPECEVCRRLLNCANRAGERWAVAIGRWP